MGVCLSCCGDGDSGQSGSSNERTHLLVDPVSSNSHNINRVQSDLSRTPNSLPRKDEESALSRILHRTQTNVIDVAALDSHDLEQHEYYDRMKTISARMNNLNRWSPPSQSGLLIDVPSADKVLAKELLSTETLRMVSAALNDITDAVAEVRVEHKEDLVVPFGIP